MRLPVKILDISRSGAQLLKEREKPLMIQVLIEVDTPEPLFELSQLFMQPKAAASIEPTLIQQGSTARLNPSADVAILLLGSGLPVTRDIVAEARRAFVPVVALMHSADLAGMMESTGLPASDILFCANNLEILFTTHLSAWLLKHLPSKKLSLAHNFPFMRKTVSLEYVRSTARQNAVVGGLVIVPGADLPVMTANQVKMILQIAAAYGESLGIRRSVELLGVIGGGLTLRSIARQAAALVPALGWVMKGGIAYTGTLAMGYAAIAYFEKGNSAESLKKKLDDLFTREVAVKDHRNSAGG